MSGQPVFDPTDEHVQELLDDLRAGAQTGALRRDSVVQGAEEALAWRLV